MTRVATSWLVYRLSHSAVALGVVGFAGQIPIFLTAPLAGVFVDRLNRHRVLLITQILAMIQSGLLAALTISGVITVPQIVILAVLQGLINAFDMPVRQAFLVEMVEDRDDLPNAIALNSSMVNFARLLGPAMAGILIAASGEGGCFAIDAVSYIFVIVSLLMMHVKPRQLGVSRQRKIRHELMEGFHYVSRFRPIRSILLMLALLSLMGMPYMILLPVVVIHELHGGANLLGILTAGSGVGALVGAAYLASRKSVLGLGRLIAIASALFGVGLVFFANSHWVWLSFFLMMVTGLAMMTQLASTNTILQTIVEEDKRGRVMSFYTMAFVGTAPFGSLWAGWAAEKFGAPRTLTVGGICIVLGSLFYMRALPEIREQIRPIYQRMGISR